MGEETNRLDGTGVPGEADTPVFDTLAELIARRVRTIGLTPTT
ncbi:hypothetical protein [Streptomyces canus]|nr:hypothetical protein [Streptomyces canus]